MHIILSLDAFENVWFLKLTHDDFINCMKKKIM